MKFFIMLLTGFFVLSAGLFWGYLAHYRSSEKISELPFHRCINIGNALDAPKGVSWGVQIQKDYFDIILSAGFDCVRMPVRFSDYVKDAPGCWLEEEFMSEIDGYIDHALGIGLSVILDLHHFEEIMISPHESRECFISIWKQLSLRYKEHPPELVFELLNEPVDNMDAGTWNSILAEAVSVIRRDNIDRYLIVGPADYYSIHRLKDLVLPDDNRIIVSIHYYLPPEFAFQGDPDHEGYEKLADIPWGSPVEVKKLTKDLQLAQNWARINNRMIFLGEFGVNRNAPAKYRELWIRLVRVQAEKAGFAWGYWEFCANFGIYDAETGKWDEQMLKALIDIDVSP